MHALFLQVSNRLTNQPALIGYALESIYNHNIRDLQVSQTFDEEWNPIIHIDMKAPSPHYFSFLQKEEIFPAWKSLTVRKEQRIVCDTANCYQSVVVSTIAKRITSPFCAFDKDGHEGHPIYTCCYTHYPKAERGFLRTLEVLHEQPNQEYWTAFLVWKAREKKFYSQKNVKRHDSDPWSVSTDYCAGSPYLGPFLTRAEAIDAARKVKV